MATRYIKATEVAVMIRKDLKSAFPAVKFSVVKRGNSINVDWVDGPITKDVDALIGWYAGSDFDPMNDLKSYHYSVLNGETVSFGSDYIFTRREYSRSACEQVANKINAKYDFKVEVKDNGYDCSVQLAVWNPSNEHFLNEELRNWTAAPEAPEAPAEEVYPEALFM